jgi:hypothetical protein
VNSEGFVVNNSDNINMDLSETELVQNEEKEENTIHLNSANRIRNKTLRRAQVLKTKRQITKVCVITSRHT